MATASADELERDVQKSVVAFLAEEFPERSAEIARLAPDAALIDLGLLDSLSFLNLVAHVEATFGIQVAPEDFSPARLGSLRQIAAYVQAARPSMIA